MFVAEKIAEAMDREEHQERLTRRAWALSAMDEEQRRRAGQQVNRSSRGDETSYSQYGNDL